MCNGTWMVTMHSCYSHKWKLILDGKVNMTKFRVKVRIDWSWGKSKNYILVRVT